MTGSVYPDIPRLYTAIAECFACALYYFALNRRIKGKAQNVAIYFGFLLVQCSFLLITRSLPLVFWIPCMFIAVIFMLLFILGTFKVSVVTGGYFAASAFLVAEFVASLEWQLHCFFIFRQGFNSIILRLVLITVVFGGVFTIFMLIEKKWFDSKFSFEVSKKELYSALLIVVIAFLFSNIGFIYQNSPFSGQSIMDIFNARTLIDLGGIAILYAYKSRVIKLNIEKELFSINTALRLQYDRYKTFHDSMDFVQIKYHDLKHQIAGLRAESDPRKRKEWLDYLEDELNFRGIEIYTGNSVLDSIITSKILYGNRHNIKITCVADGSLLDFMHVTDICAIFGNALDNAIEGVIVLSDRESRIIHITVTSQKTFLFISVENYCGYDVGTSDGFPETTKADKANHGFGIKSIEYSAKKYGGEVSVSTGNNKFELRVIIPLSS